MVENDDYGEFKGTTKEAIRDVRKDVKYIRAQMDKIVEMTVNHEKRLVRIESSGKMAKWAFGALIAIMGLAMGIARCLIQYP